MVDESMSAEPLDRSLSFTVGSEDTDNKYSHLDVANTDQTSAPVHRRSVPQKPCVRFPYKYHRLMMGTYNKQWLFRSTK